MISLCDLVFLCVAAERFTLDKITHFVTVKLSLSLDEYELITIDLVMTLNVVVTKGLHKSLIHATELNSA